ncbi:IS1380 family transposase, partial [Kribbella sp. NPDC048915]|uniref:IS1380 family transposase n=1 Tax=Kribbella sp. NPDC048915 TaxID=3155148 RepID=UPI0033FD706F
APVVVAQRLRKGSVGSPRGAKRLVTDALKTVRGLRGVSPGAPLVRADSAFYGRGLVLAAVRAGADVSVTVRLDKRVKAALEVITDDPDAWTPIEYTDAIFDEQTGQWISRAEVAEIPYTAFASRSKAERVPGRLVIRRIPDLNPGKSQASGQETLFDTWRFHAFFTTTDTQTMDTVTADKTHRGHAIIEQVNADLKDSALAHLPSGVFTANAAWLVLAVMAFNLTRAAATLAGPELAKSRTGTIRRKLINIAARIASSARRITLHLPLGWPWQQQWTALFNHVCGPPATATP